MNNIEEFIEQYNASYPEEKEWCAIYPLQMKAIENLIQENKELKERRKNTMDLIGANYIHKDKVKEKIKYIEKNYGEHSEFSIGKSIEFLQELL